MYWFGQGKEFCLVNSLIYSGKYFPLKKLAKHDKINFTLKNRPTSNVFWSCSTLYSSREVLEASHNFAFDK